MSNKQSDRMRVADAGQTGTATSSNNAESAVVDEAGVEQQKPLTPEAQRALAEAEDRRKSAMEAAAGQSAEKELGGQRGPEPTRFGDWEKGGIISDF